MTFKEEVYRLLGYGVIEEGKGTTSVERKVRRDEIFGSIKDANVLAKKIAKKYFEVFGKDLIYFNNGKAEKDAYLYTSEYGDGLIYIIDYYLETLAEKIRKDEDYNYKFLRTITKYKDLRDEAEKVLRINSEDKRDIETYKEYYKKYYKKYPESLEPRRDTVVHNRDGGVLGIPSKYYRDRTRDEKRIARTIQKARDDGYVN